MPKSRAAAPTSANGQTSKGASPALPALNPRESFQDLILTLHQFWSAQGCAVAQF